MCLWEQFYDWNIFYENDDCVIYKDSYSECSLAHSRGENNVQVFEKCCFKNLFTAAIAREKTRIKEWIIFVVRKSLIY